MAPNRGARKKTPGLEPIDALRGKVGSDPEKQGLMHAVLEEKKAREQGRLLNEMINQGSGFLPDETFKNLVHDYKFAEKLYGRTFIREITGYDPNFVKKNLPLPEFRRELKEKIQEKFNELERQQLLSSGQVTDKGYTLSSLLLYMEELDTLLARGMGEKIQKKQALHGVKKAMRKYRKGDLYRNLALKSSLKQATRRRHSSLLPEDLQSHERLRKGRVNIVYGFDSSGSMKGRKLEMAKKAGIALMYHALSNKDKVGLVLFRKETLETIPPSNDFSYLLEKIARVRALHETNIAKAIRDAMPLYPHQNLTKHLVLITDAMPTVGKDPEKETLEAAAMANANSITISLIGINLNKKGRELARKITEIGRGRMYVVRDVAELDALVLQDYSQL